MAKDTKKKKENDHTVYYAGKYLIILDSLVSCGRGRRTHTPLTAAAARNSSKINEKRGRRRKQKRTCSESPKNRPAATAPSWLSPRRGVRTWEIGLSRLRGGDVLARFSRSSTLFEALATVFTRYFDAEPKRVVCHPPVSGHRERLSGVLTYIYRVRPVYSHRSAASRTEHASLRRFNYALKTEDDFYLAYRLIIRIAFIFVWNFRFYSLSQQIFYKKYQ